MVTTRVLSFYTGSVHTIVGWHIEKFSFTLGVLDVLWIRNARYCIASVFFFLLYLNVMFDFEFFFFYLGGSNLKFR